MKPRLSVWEKEIASIENKIAAEKSKLHLRGLAGSAPASFAVLFIPLLRLLNWWCSTTKKKPPISSTTLNPF
jgi:hypothetical protein